MRALYIGRFQPYHLGHHAVIKQIASEAEVDEVIICIGSAQRSHELEDPFTAGERYLMISKSLRDDGVLNFYIVPILDVNWNAVWVSHVESLIPPVEVVFTNNPLIGRLFSEKGYEVRTPSLFNRREYAGREIRRRMLNHEQWRELVPKAVLEVVCEIDGLRRLENLSRSDF
ncbi:nicotinamide-nucleotide adenylyltransferase [ANME-1 cluster archaeon ex4572_4]|nr:MAG: nicotinamide-nucleotide adenylyltransferase [ANME-1 cluster archaeon ex4572_4]PXF50201.1 MAG: nicotinamide-nucleotide adenylyltransferase [Methanophagales archaeon]